MLDFRSVDEFHVARRMFAVINDELVLAPERYHGTHIEWFCAVGYVSSTDDPAFEQIVRGYYLPGEHIVAYRGKNFEAWSAEAETLMKYLRPLQNQLGFRDNLPVFVGSRPNGKVVWEPQKPLGTVEQALGRWQGICEHAAKKLVGMVADGYHFKIKHHNHEQMPIQGRFVRESSGAISIYFTGYGNRTMENGYASVLHLEVGDDGHPTLYLFEDYDQEEFTQKISFAKAREKQVASDE